MKRFLRRVTLVAILLLFCVTMACGAEAGTTPLTLGTAYAAVIPTQGAYAYFSFTPSETGIYDFYSTASEDTYGYLYNADMVELTRDDDGGESTNFKITYPLSAGTEYFFGARYFSSGETGSFDVSIVKHPGTYIIVDGDMAVEAEYGEPATLRVFASSWDDVEFSYQWYVDTESTISFEEIPGATEAAYTIPSVTEPGEYRCQVSYDDDWQSVYFNVSIDNRLTVSPAGGDSDIYVTPGSTALLQVQASCVRGGLHYQWYDGTSYVRIDGATDSSLTTAAISAHAEYYCMVEDDYGNSDSVWFVLHIDNQLTVSAVGSNSYYVRPGSSATLGVRASCAAGGLTYQWYDGTSYARIDGATEPSFNVENITGYQRYYCTVRDEYDNERSLWFYISIDNELRVSESGESEFYLKPGQSVTLAVDASCAAGGLTYQWYDDNEEEVISGATGPSYTVDVFSAYNSYRCTVSDEYGNSRSVWFYVYIENDFSVRADGDWEYTVNPGDSVTLRVSASCAYGSLSYQWYGYDEDGDNAAIEGATDAAYTVNNIRAFQEFYCLVKDEYGNSDSVWFHLYINNGFTARAVGGTRIAAAPGDMVELAVEASCDSGALSYQWYDDWSGQALLRGTSPSYILQNVSSSHSYYCHVEDDFGNIRNIWFYIYIDNGFSAVAAMDPKIYVFPGESATLAVNASCDYGELSFDWYDENSGSHVGRDATLTIENVRTAESYYCYVSDEYGNSQYISFTVYIENGFSVEAVGSTEISVRPGGTVTLELSAYCDYGDLTYGWYGESYDEEWEEWNNIRIDSNGPVCTIENVVSNGEYYCIVRDIYGNSQEVWFFVYLDNGLEAWATSASSIAVTPGGAATFSVSAECDQGELQYQWYQLEEDEEDLYWQRIYGVTGSTYTAGNVRAFSEYRCSVTDMYGNTRHLWFDAYIDNRFTASAVGDQVLHAEAGKSLTLRVSASAAAGDIRYQWYQSRFMISGANSPEYTTPVLTNGTRFSCEIQDMYGNAATIDFTCLLDSISIQLDTPISVSLDYGETLLVPFVPDVTGTYTLASSGSYDTYGYLYAADWEVLEQNDDDADSYNFKLTHRLTAGTQYYFSVRFYSSDTSGTFPLLLTRLESGKTYSIALRANQTVVLPAREGGIQSVSSGNTAVVRTSGATITAASAGSAVVTANYGDYSDTYNVTVYADSGVLRLPAALAQIQSEGFSGDTGIRFVELSDAVVRVERDAFKGSGLLQIIVPAAGTRLVSGAFRETNPTIVCRAGSYAESFAQRYGFAYVYLR